MWRIIHLIAGTKSGVDAIATKGEANFDVGSPSSAVWDMRASPAIWDS